MMSPLFLGPLLKFSVCTSGTTRLNVWFYESSRRTENNDEQRGWFHLPPDYTLLYDVIASYELLTDVALTYQW